VLERGISWNAPWGGKGRVKTTFPPLSWSRIMKEERKKERKKPPEDVREKKGRRCRERETRGVSPPVALPPPFLGV